MHRNQRDRYVCAPGNSAVPDIYRAGGAGRTDGGCRSPGRVAGEVFAADERGRVNITLIGYRGTGKSTVARLVANRLGWSWVDADAYLEQRANRTISEIFAAEGETGFRALESALLSELTGRDQTVIAAGGGAVLRPENRLAIRRSGFTVWLVATPSTIHHRLSLDPSTASRRPRLTDHDELNEIRLLLAEREPHYRECADLTVDTECQLPDQVAQQIVEAIAVKEPAIRKE